MQFATILVTIALKSHGVVMQVVIPSSLKISFYSSDCGLLANGLGQGHRLRRRDDSRRPVSWNIFYENTLTIEIQRQDLFKAPKYSKQFKKLTNFEQKIEHIFPAQLPNNWLAREFPTSVMALTLLGFKDWSSHQYLTLHGASNIQTLNSGSWDYCSQNSRGCARHKIPCVTRTSRRLPLPHRRWTGSMGMLSPSH